MKIAIVGDYRPHNATHRALTDGLTMAGAEVEWVPSNEVDSRAERLAGYGGVVAAPGSPYAGMEGVWACPDSVDTCVMLLAPSPRSAARKQRG